jgi:hypothetical protein
MESARIQRVLDDARVCAAATALARARALYGESRSCCAAPPQPGADVPSSSSYLRGRVCPAVVGVTVQPESVRIAKMLQSNVDNWAPPTDPERRFVEYQGPVLQAVCPPIDQIFTNANVPRLQGNSCPLDNKPFNPVLPG